MSNSSLYQWIAQFPILFFVFWFGACVGSFINVLAYRIPKGLDFVTPTSRCPKCEHKLGWRENIPILGWLLLRGRCRFCKDPISPEYPIVESVVALLFATLFMAWFMNPSPFEFLGLTQEMLRPEWALAGFKYTWPTLSIMLVLVGSLVAMTIIDAKSFFIPLFLPWILAFYALIVHTGHAIWIGSTGMGRLPVASPHEWVIPTVAGDGAWPFALAALGGGVGLLVSFTLTRLGVIPQSFADMEEWEKQAEAERAERLGQHEESPEHESAPDDSRTGSMALRLILFTGPIIALMFLGSAIGARSGKWGTGMLVGGAVGALLGVLLRRLAPEDEPSDDDPVWTLYPFARREVLKEVAFLAPIVALLVGGWFAGQSMASQATTPAEPALWLKALSGSLAGLLAGGGVVWIVRILGTLAFGKEAIGLGDVHLMAGVGAALGWIDPILAFFLAPFSGIAWALGSSLFARILKAPRVLPYGPHLALATLVIVYARPAIEGLLTVLAKQPVNLP